MNHSPSRAPLVGLANHWLQRSTNPCQPGAFRFLTTRAWMIGDPIVIPRSSDLPRRTYLRDSTCPFRAKWVDPTLGSMVARTMTSETPARAKLKRLLEAVDAPTNPAARSGSVSRPTMARWMSFRCGVMERVASSRSA
jgi:hypothetical protein